MSDYGHYANNQLKLIPPFEFQEPEAEDFPKSMSLGDSKEPQTGNEQIESSDNGVKTAIA